MQLITDSSRPLTADELAAFRDLIKRRRGGEPIAYILGRREFWGLNFRTDKRALVPRPDTETLVEVALERTRHLNLFGTALDVCTGSGCVAIAFHRERPTWRVMGSDISTDALELARENALRLGSVWGMSWLESDLFEQIPATRKLDLITANAPYIPRAELAELDVDVREFEPSLALDGGEDGLDLIRRLAPAALERLAPGGVLALELHYDQANRVEALLSELGFENTLRKKDYAGHERVVSAQKPR